MTLTDAIQTHRHSILYLDGAESTDLLFYKLEGTEGLSELYEWRVTAVAERGEVNPDDWVGHECTVMTSVAADEGTRYFGGICTEMRCGRPADSSSQDLWVGNEFELVIRPPMWLLTRRSNSRIFADQSLSAILSAVLDGYSGLTYEIDGSVPTATIPYCVQYQETDFAFVSRLLEKYGLIYMMSQAESGVTLVIGDTSIAADDAVDYAFLGMSEAEAVSKRAISNMALDTVLRSDKAAINDYDYEAATTPLTDAQITSPSHGSTGNELYEYPYGYANGDNSADLATFKLDAERSEVTVISGELWVSDLGAGHKLKVAANPLPGQSDSDTYLVVRARHFLVSDSYQTAVADKEKTGPMQIAQYTSYAGRIEAIPAEVPFRVPRRTPWPRIPGAQTAKVVGTGEIDVDDQGRILVHFHWEREAKNSCRVRVAQPWAGNDWGGSFIPRVDMEVMVEFVDGDPDRPLVTGAVYNSANAYPIETSNKTRSGFKSNSSEGGNGYNMFAFDDSAGSEEIYLHAQKDLYKKILNDEKVEITQNRTVTIESGNDELTVSQGDMTVTVTSGTVKIDAGTKIELICGSSKITMDTTSITIESVDITVDASASVTAKGAQAEVNGSAQTTIKGGTVMIN